MQIPSRRRGCSILALAVALTWFPDQAQATGGQFGLEFAIDAPWRLEPVPAAGGGYSYGPIPITIAFHDAAFEAGRGRVASYALPKIPVGRLREVRIVEWTADQPHPRHPVTILRPENFREIEKRALVSTKTREPQAEVCRPAPGQDCSSFLDITRTHDWQASAWYTPKAAVVPGRNIHLEITVVTDSTEMAGLVPMRREWRNYLVVHAGEQPLPRFGDDWLYGDLHYHSQMTDNEGETGYSYRNVARALGAMGVDFVFATDHASNGSQVDGKIDSAFCADSSGGSCMEARDLNPSRFAAAKAILYGPDGVNEAIAREANVNGIARFRTARVLPQVYMGEEVDAIPEMSSREYQDGRIYYGDGQRYAWPDSNGCIAAKGLTKCKEIYSIDYAPRDHRSRLVLDEQGIPVEEEVDSAISSETGRDIVKYFTPDLTAAAPSRQHIVYFPSSARLGAQGFVSSDTGRFGGGGKRLQDVISEIQAGGFAFLAHPVDGRRPGSAAGPDIVPYSDRALDRAWASPAILGLQLWNENEFVVSAPDRLSPTIMFVGQDMNPPEGGGPRTRYSFNWPFQGHRFGNFPWQWQKYAGSARLRDLYHGAYAWDRYLRKGLDPQQTAALGWLPAGEPRKWFMAGGSDAHGDFNFRRKGRPCMNRWCDVPISDTAIASPRNLVSLSGPTGGQPVLSDGVRDATSGPIRYSNQQVLGALRSGRFSVTDGPAVRIIVDQNRNGEIDSSDLPMGSTLDFYPGEHIPLLVEWFSTREFGPVATVDLFVGNARMTFAPPDVRPEQGGAGYRQDPSGALQIRLANGYGQPITGQPPELRYRGVARVFLGPAQFGLAPADGTLSYVRAVARTIAPHQGADLGICASAWTAGNRCGGRIAYSNPIWNRYRLACPAGRPGPMGSVLRPALPVVDADGNRFPDTCERDLPRPCPRVGGGRFDDIVGVDPRRPPVVLGDPGGRTPASGPAKPIPSDSCQFLSAL